jgi:2-polyprenyl-3-methyl-5-hydroxy-6-metoxy-1,4-benzoquinol methylase
MSCIVCSQNRFEPLFDKDGHHFERCESCGLQRVWPQPTDAVLGQIYGEGYYAAWGLQHEENREIIKGLKQQTFARLFERLPAYPPGSKLLDCGAATGYLLELAARSGFDPYGVELSSYGAEQIAKRFGADHVFQGELSAARFSGVEEGAFSVVFMCDFLEHVRDPRSTLAAAYRLLKVGGTLVVTTPDTGSFTHSLMRSAWTHYKVEHLFYFNRKNLANLLRASGFHHRQTIGAKKTINLDYALYQFRRYPHPLLSRGAELAWRTAPKTLTLAPLSLLMGEQAAFAVKT